MKTNDSIPKKQYTKSVVWEQIKEVLFCVPPLVLDVGGITILKLILKLGYKHPQSAVSPVPKKEKKIGEKMKVSPQTELPSHL